MPPQPLRGLLPAQAPEGDHGFQRHSRIAAPASQGGNPLGQLRVSAPGVESIFHEHRIRQIADGPQGLRRHFRSRVGFCNRQQPRQRELRRLTRQRSKFKPNRPLRQQRLPLQPHQLHQRQRLRMVAALNWEARLKALPTNS